VTRYRSGAPVSLRGQARLLRPELADAELRTDSADGGNTSSCQVSREHHGGALPERIGDVQVECWPGATAGACTLRMITINNSYDTTAATAATPTTASAVDHLITRSVASPPATADQRELGHEHALV
jgi:hypothetical protein